MKSDKYLSYNRRSFLKKAITGTAAIAALPNLSGCTDRNKSQKLFLLRYDTEYWGDWKDMEGFIEKVIAVHNTMEIPATFFCKGEMLEKNHEVFMNFYAEVKNNPLFDFQDHSYSHIGIGYSEGKPVDDLKADYERSFNAHEKIFKKRPIGIARCGTSGADGPALAGFDVTEKSKAELDMLASIGMKMIDSFLSGFDGSRLFINYASLGHPDIMGFPSGYSDTSWLVAKEFGDPVEYIMNQIKDRSARNEHFPLMCHDWAAWQHAPDKELTHLKKIVDQARREEYELVTHTACYHQENLWKS